MKRKSERVLVSIFSRPIRRQRRGLALLVCFTVGEFQVSVKMPPRSESAEARLQRSLIKAREKIRAYGRLDEWRVKKLKLARRALEFYAEERLYVNIGVRADLYEDQGKLARKTLKEIG